MDNNNTINPISQVGYHTHNGNDSPSLFINSMRNIYIGNVTLGGVKGITFPANWTISKGGSGVYTINHNLGTTNYIVVATAFFGNTTQDTYITNRQQTTSFFTVRINSATGVTDAQWSFILIKF